MSKPYTERPRKELLQAIYSLRQNNNLIRSIVAKRNEQIKKYRRHIGRMRLKVKLLSEEIIKDMDYILKHPWSRIRNWRKK